MIGNLFFSYLGLIFLLLLFIPNIICTRKKPQGYTSKNENKVLLTFERIGEFMTTMPIVSFFLLGIYWKVIWILVVVIILGVGHIGIHMQHNKALKTSR